MVASAPARIVNVSSFRHFCVRKLDLKLLTGEERTKNASQAYDCTKLMNGVSFAGVANVVSPGIVRTEILALHGRASRLLYWLCSAFMRSPQKGAISTLYCAVAPEVKGISGKYFDSNCTLVLPQALAQDPALGQRLWDALEKATGLKMDSQQAVSGPLPRGVRGFSLFMAGEQKSCCSATWISESLSKNSSLPSCQALRTANHGQKSEIHPGFSLML
ncbi:hypothetical protein E2320_000052 [Naja naja]|nr:hypothetical protein E2320_000052 [Naja naja]